MKQIKKILASVVFASLLVIYFLPNWHYKFKVWWNNIAEKLTLKLILKLISVGIIAIVLLSLFNVYYPSHTRDEVIAKRKAREFFFWRDPPLQ